MNTNESGSSSSPPFESSSHNKNGLNNETEETETEALTDSDDSPEMQDTENLSYHESKFMSQYEDMMKVIDYCSKKEYRHPLVAPLLCLRFLLKYGVDIYDRSFDGSAYNDVPGLLRMLSEYDDNIDEDVIKNAPLIQVDMIKACSKETIKSIVEDIGGDYYGILVDKEVDSIALFLRYVDKTGDVVERFLSIVNVVDTGASSLKNAICSLLEKHSLSSSKIRAQGYNELSNIGKNFNGVQTLIKNETQSAYFSHCFVNHFELTLVEKSKESVDRVSWFFSVLQDLVHVILLCLKENELQGKSHFVEVAKALESSMVEIAYCLTLKVKLGRDNDNTCFKAYCKLVSNVVDYYPVILELLDTIWYEPLRSVRDKLSGVNFLLIFDRKITIENFDFIFVAHLMKMVLEVTNKLSLVLQKKDKSIVKAMSLVKSVKEQLQMLRDEGWETLLKSVTSVCNKNDIEVPNMEDLHQEPNITKLHLYKVDVFFATIDQQLQELNSRFDETNMELLVCMGSLSPVDSFRAFDKQKLLRLAEFYPNEFSSIDLHRLSDQVDNYIHDVKRDQSFVGLKDLKELSKKLVKVKKHEVYDLVYLLIKLVLILPVATAGVERAFKGMSFVNQELKNKKESDELLNARLVTYVERDVLSEISNDDIINTFQSMKKTQV